MLSPDGRRETVGLLAEARRVDPERTLCVLLAPAPRRAELLALLLLDHELERIAPTVRQPLAGLLRLRFWRDQLAAAAAGGPVDHPLARRLAPALAEGRLPLAGLEALLAARESELDGLAEPGAAPPGPPPGPVGLEARVRATAGGLARAMALLLAAGPGLLAAAEAAGTAHGLVGVVGATPREAARARPLPLRSLAADAGLGPRGPAGDAARATLRALAGTLLDRAEALVGEARRAGRAADRARLAPLLLATVAEARLRALRRVGGDPLRAAERPGPATLPLRLLLAWLLGRP